MLLLSLGCVAMSKNSVNRLVLALVVGFMVTSGIYMHTELYNCINPYTVYVLPCRRPTLQVSLNAYVIVLGIAVGI